MTQFFKVGKPLHSTCACTIPSTTGIQIHNRRLWIPARNNTDGFPAPAFYVSTLVNSLWCSQHEHDIQITSHPSLDQTRFPARHLVGDIQALTNHSTLLCVSVYTHTPLYVLSVFHRGSLGLALFIDKQLTPKFIRQKDFVFILLTNGLETMEETLFDSPGTYLILWGKCIQLTVQSVM